MAKKKVGFEKKIAISIYILLVLPLLGYIIVFFFTKYSVFGNMLFANPICWILSLILGRRIRILSTQYRLIGILSTPIFVLYELLGIGITWYGMAYLDWWFW